MYALLLQATNIAAETVAQVAPHATQVIVEKTALSPTDALLNSVVSQGPYAVLLFLFLYVLWRQYQKLEVKFDALQASKDVAMALKEEEKTKLRAELSVSEHKLAGMTQNAIHSLQSLGWALLDIQDNLSSATKHADEDREVKAKEMEQVVRQCIATEVKNLTDVIKDAKQPQD